MAELLNPKGEATWQLNKSISDMSCPEKLEALGYLQALILGGHRDIRYIYRASQIKKDLPHTPRKRKEKSDQLQLFDIHIKGQRK